MSTARHCYSFNVQRRPLRKGHKSTAANKVLINCKGQRDYYEKLILKYSGHMVSRGFQGLVCMQIQICFMLNTLTEDPDVRLELVTLNGVALKPRVSSERTRENSKMRTSEDSYKI